MSKAKFDAVKELINEKKYAEAKALLKTIDHPTAREWEAKVDKLSPTLVTAFAPSSQVKPDLKRRRRWPLLILGGTFLACIIVYAIGSNPAVQEMSRATSTAQAIAVAGTNEALTVSNGQTATVIALTPPTETATTTQTLAPSATPTITETPLPTSTFTPTSTPSLEDQARKIINEVLAGEDVERISITDIGSPKLLAVDYPMPQIFDYRVDFAGTEMLKIACALHGNGFGDDWRYQFSAMIDLVNKTNGQTSRDDGLSGRVNSSTVAGWNCENVTSMDPSFALDDYILNPILNK